MPCSAAASPINNRLHAKLGLMYRFALCPAKDEDGKLWHLLISEREKTAFSVLEELLLESETRIIETVDERLS